ncbi:uncharacterized protein LOC134256231 [Saccostrea cucullata]|uniref:uncharacterized protein LOC134256231 n=1 Tax=Saccostrea cuccullata TaxID=36930 RepID=UPI002ED53443
MFFIIGKNSKKNEERNKNPVLRELLQQPLKQAQEPPKRSPPKQQEQQKQNMSPKNFSDFQTLWSNLQLELDLKNFDSGNSPQEEEQHISPTLDFSDMDDQSVLFQKYLVPEKPTPAPRLETSEKTSPPVRTILKKVKSAPCRSTKNPESTIVHPTFIPITQPKESESITPSHNSAFTTISPRNILQENEAFTGVEDSILTELRRRHRLKRRMVQRIPAVHPYPLHQDLKSLRELKEAMSVNLQQMDTLINYLEDFFRLRRVNFVSV